MPIEIKKKTTYLLDVKIPSLQIDRQTEVDESGLHDMLAEVEVLYEALMETVGGVNLGQYRTTTAKQKVPTTMASTKLMEYAQTHADFTIKCASEALDISEGTLYAIAMKLIDAEMLMRQQVLGGMAYIYKLHPKQIAAQKEKEKVIVLPNGKFPFVPKANPERERMQSK